MAGQSVVEKIAQRYAQGLPEGAAVRSGDFIEIRPRHVMTHDNTAAVIPKFEATGAVRVHDSSQPVFCLDHDIQNRSPENLAKYRKIEEFAHRHGIRFHGAGRGIGHQVMVEEGFVLPGTFVVASDSHSNLYGALGALGTPVVRTDAAAIWASGKTWWQVPPVVRVRLEGSLRKGVGGKDLIIALIGAFSGDDVLNACVEFDGPGVASMTMDQRMTVANMTTEWGALAGVFPCDEVTLEYLKTRASRLRERDGDGARLTEEEIERAVSTMPRADDPADYFGEIVLDLSSITPYVAGPGEVKAVAPLDEVAARNIAVDKAFLLSCVNGRLEDFIEAADILRGRSIAPGVQLYIAAASAEVEDDARRCGAWDVLLQAGATALPPGCGPCIGLGEGLLAEGEVGISATNRNFRGRMGSREAHVYLASPAVVAASAAAGTIQGPSPSAGGVEAPRGLSARALRERSRLRQAEVSAGAIGGTTEIRPGFPRYLEGELLYVPKDDMNTDAIYGKEFMYRAGLSTEEMARAAMRNHDPEFQSLAREGDILVGGLNFGSGSSREQAATALKYRGIQMVLAASFSQTYKRNAFNNGFLVLECPTLVDDLRAAHGGDARATIRTGRRAVIDFTRSTVHCEGKDHPFPPLGAVAQELIVAGGLEAKVRMEAACT